MQYLERNCLLLVTAASDLLVRTIRFRSVVFGVTSSLGRSCAVETRRRSLVITRGAWWSNTRIPAINEKPATSAIYKPRCSSYWSQSQIFVENRDFSVPRLHSRPPLRGVPVKILPCRLVRKKTRIMGLPDCEKILMMCLFVLTKLTNVTDGQTDRQTPHDGKGRAWWSWSRAVEPRRRWLVITRGA